MKRAKAPTVYDTRESFVHLGVFFLSTYSFRFLNTPSACGGVTEQKWGPGLALGFNTFYLSCVCACNGCDIEVIDVFTPYYNAERFGTKLVASPRHADELLWEDFSKEPFDHT